MLPDWLPWLLQVNDSQFPSGSYAHSQGLEELVQSGIVRDAAGLRDFLHRQIIPGLCAFDLPYLVRAHAAAARGDVPALVLLDEELNAWKLAAELRQASRQMGSRRLALVRKLHPSPFLESYAEAVSPQHHLIVCAAELRTAPPEVAACAFGVQSLSGFCTASMKLIRIGQERCQSLLREAVTSLTGQIGPAIAEAGEKRIGWFNPLLEIAGMRHARARERLFIS